MKHLILVLFIINYSSLFACDCENPNMALEFLDSEYVAEAVVKDKIYSSDKFYYTIILDLKRHYKNANKYPEILSFRFKSEENPVKTSCDFYLDKNDKLLVFIKESNDKKFFDFSLLCSNSRKLNNIGLNEQEKLVLENANNFNLKKYVFGDMREFQKSHPITNIDSIISSNKTIIPKDERNQFLIVMVDIDDNGDIENANLYPKNHKLEMVKIDSIFNLNFIKNKHYRNPKNLFEEYVLKIARSIKKWEPYYHIKTNQKVRHRKLLKFYFDPNQNLVVEY